LGIDGGVEVKDCDDFGGGSAFEGGAAVVGGWVIDTTINFLLKINSCVDPVVANKNYFVRYATNHHYF
jgi:hypothetical protein